MFGVQVPNLLFLNCSPFSVLLILIFLEKLVKLPEHRGVDVSKEFLDVLHSELVDLHLQLLHDLISLVLVAIEFIKLLVGVVLDGNDLVAVGLRDLVPEVGVQSEEGLVHDRLDVVLKCLLNNVLQL